MTNRETRGGGALTPPTALAADHDCAGFSCGHEALDDRLRNFALRSEGKSSRTYVVCEEGKVVGYYCLSTAAATRASMPGRIRHGLPDPVPLMILGRLAVDQNHQGRQIGSSLLRDAMRKVLAAAEIVGCRALVVHAIDDAAASFYLRYGFGEFPSGSRTLFLPVETIASAIQ